MYLCTKIQIWWFAVLRPWDLGKSVKGINMVLLLVPDLAWQFLKWMVITIFMYNNLKSSTVKMPHQWRRSNSDNLLLSFFFSQYVFSCASNPAWSHLNKKKRTTRTGQEKYHCWALIYQNLQHKASIFYRLLRQHLPQQLGHQLVNMKNDIEGTPVRVSKWRVGTENGLWTTTHHN